MVRKIMQEYIQVYIENIIEYFKKKYKNIKSDSYVEAITHEYKYSRNSEESYSH